MRIGYREKRAVWYGAAALSLLAVMLFWVLPRREDTRLLERKAEARREVLRKVGELRDRLVRLPAAVPAQRAGDVSLFSFLEKSAEETRVKAKIRHMKPMTGERIGRIQENVVELRMEALALAELVEFLAAVEASEHGVSVRRLSVEKSPGRDLLDVNLWVAAAERG